MNIYINKMNVSKTIKYMSKIKKYSDGKIAKFPIKKHFFKILKRFYPKAEKINYKVYLFKDEPYYIIYLSVHCMNKKLESIYMPLNDFENELKIKYKYSFKIHFIREIELSPCYDYINLFNEMIDY